MTAMATMMNQFIAKVIVHFHFPQLLQQDEQLILGEKCILAALKENS